MKCVSKKFAVFVLCSIEILLFLKLIYQTSGSFVQSMSNMIVRVRKKYSGYRIKRKKKTGLIFFLD